MKVLIAGATGFVGSNLVSELAAAGHDIVVFARPGSNFYGPQASGIKTIMADPSKSLEIILDGVEAVINSIGIIREFPSKEITFKKVHIDITRNLVDSAVKNKIPRFLQISALGVNSDGKTGYQISKYKAEQLIINSSLVYTIFRPSMLFGPGDKSINFFADLIKRLPLVPVIGDGQYRLQPLFIEDLCRALAASLKRPDFNHKIVELGGPDIFTYDSMLDTLGAAMGRKSVPKIHLPVSPMRLAACLLGGFKSFPLSNEQITMLLEENFVERGSFETQFGFAPARLSDTIRNYIK